MSKPHKLEHGHTVIFDDDKHVYIKNGNMLLA